MAPARDGAGDDAAPVAPAERAWGSGLGGVSAVISVPWALVAVLFVLTAVFYEDAMELRMHARRAMFGDRAEGSVLLPRAFARRGTPPTPPRGWELDAEDGTASPARKFGPADAATGWRDPPAADGVEAAPATTLDPPADDDSTDPAPVGPDDASSPSASASSPSLTRPSRANDVIESAKRAARGFVKPAGGASDPDERDAPPPHPPPPPLVVRSAADLHPGGPVPLPDVDPSVGGEWRSVGRVRRMANADVTRSDDALREAAELRSFRREIIVMVSNRAGAHLAANSVAMLRRVGVEHYLLLTNAKETCEEIRAGPWGVQCGWTSYLMNHPRLVAYALTNEEMASPFRLWWARFHVLERLVAFGYNPMYVDTDVSFRYNPYPLLKGPFGKYQLVGQDETGRLTGVNIGLVYAQNAEPGGGAHWVLNETVSRMLQILEHAPEPVKRWDGKTAEGAKEHLWDQHIYNDVLESAAFGRDLRRRSGQRLIDPAGRARDEWVKASGFPEDASLAWDVEEVVVSDADVPTSPDDATKRAPVDVGPHRVHVKTIRAIETPTATATTAATRADGERGDAFLAAPAWFLGGWSGVAGDLEFQGVNGRWNLDPCPVVVAHLVGALSKQTTMKQLGWWAYGADVYRAAESLERSSTTRLDGVLAVRGLAAVGRREDDPAAAQEAYGLAIARIVELAVAAGRRPAIPALDCAAPWIARGSEFSFLGVRDREKVIVGAKCDADSAAGGGGGYPDRAPARGDPGLGPCCASVNLGCDETAFVLQVDLDRDPRLQSAQDDVAYARWDSLPMTKDPTSGEDVFDGEALEAATKGPALLIVEMDEEGGREGDEDEGEGAGAGGGRGGRRRRGELPATGRLTAAQRTRVEAFFRACGRVDCRPPRRPFPHDFSQCAAP